MFHEVPEGTPEFQEDTYDEQQDEFRDEREPYQEEEEEFRDDEKFQGDEQFNEGDEQYQEEEVFQEGEEEPQEKEFKKEQPKLTPKQRWHRAYNKIVMQLNVSTLFDYAWQWNRLLFVLISFVQLILFDISTLKILFMVNFDICCGRPVIA